MNADENAIEAALNTIDRINDMLCAPVPSGEVETPPELMGIHDAAGLDHLAEAEAAWVARDAMEARLVEALTDLHELRAGEVETPCATCGETRQHIIARLPTGQRIGSGAPCPDCGVETPEAAVEAGAEIYARWRHFIRPDLPVDKITSERVGPFKVSMANARQFMPKILDALSAQGWTPPGGEDAK